MKSFSGFVFASATAMEAVKAQILAFDDPDWSDRKKGQAIVLLTDDNVRNLEGLPDAMLKGGLEELLSQGKPKN